MRTTILAALLLAPLASAQEPATTPPAEPATAEPAPTALPDIEATAERGRCERPAVQKRSRVMPGADQTYTGAFTVADDGAVTGFEKRILFANTAWKGAKAEMRGYDCVVVWNIVGRKAPVTACESCDFGFHFQADVDYAKSTCPQRITVDGNHFYGAYDVKKKPDGTAEIFFSNSGTKLAQGHWSGGSFNWITEHQCQWF